ncbi:MAG: carboxypeptidase-like regulatory domain-containing protein [Thermoguttaceae bacterium]
MAMADQAFSGMVSLDGEPFVGAVISFRPAPGAGGHTSGAATDSAGNFSVSAAKGLMPGKYVVSIQKWKGTGRTFKDPQSGKTIEITAPISFNEEKALAITVAANGQNHFDFSLTSVNKK